MLRPRPPRRERQVQRDARADRRDSRWRGRRRLRDLYRAGPAAAQPDPARPDVGGCLTRRGFLATAAAALAVTDFPDWQAPQAHATAINTTGVPLLRNITVVRDAGPFAAGTTTSIIHFTFSPFYEGYLLELIPSNPGVNIAAADLVIQHIDASANILAIEQVTLSNFQNLGNNTCMVRGRLLGIEIGVQLQVANSAWINGVTGSVVTADAVSLRICGLQTYVPNTGKRVPVIEQSDGLLLGSQSTIPLGAVANVESLVSVLPDYTGPVIVSSWTGLGGGFTYEPRIRCFTVSGGTSAIAVLDFPKVLLDTPLIAQVSLPSCFNVANIVQRSTVANNAGYNVIINAADQ